MLAALPLNFWSFHSLSLGKIGGLLDYYNNRPERAGEMPCPSNMWLLTAPPYSPNWTSPPRPSTLPEQSQSRRSAQSQPSDTSQRIPANRTSRSQSRIALLS